MAARVSPFAFACLLALLAGDAAAVDLGRLFLTPPERERLDRLRRGEPVTAPLAAPAAPAPDPAITGFVKRSDGKHTVWIDGRPVTTSDPRAGSLHPREVRDDTNLPPSAVRPTRPK